MRAFNRLELQLEPSHTHIESNYAHLKNKIGVLKEGLSDARLAIESAKMERASAAAKNVSRLSPPSFFATRYGSYGGSSSRERLGVSDHRVSSGGASSSMAQRGLHHSASSPSSSATFGIGGELLMTTRRAYGETHNSRGNHLSGTGWLIGGKGPRDGSSSPPAIRGNLATYVESVIQFVDRGQQHQPHHQGVSVNSPSSHSPTMTKGGRDSVYDRTISGGDESEPSLSPTAHHAAAAPEWTTSFSYSSQPASQANGSSYKSSSASNVSHSSSSSSLSPSTTSNSNVSFGVHAHPPPHARLQRQRQAAKRKKKREREEKTARVMEEEMHDTWKARVRERNIRRIISEYSSSPLTNIEKFQLEKKRKELLERRLGPGLYDMGQMGIDVRHADRPSHYFSAVEVPFDIRNYSGPKRKFSNVRRGNEKKEKDNDYSFRLNKSREKRDSGRRKDDSRNDKNEGKRENSTERRAFRSYRRMWGDKNDSGKNEITQDILQGLPLPLRKLASDPNFSLTPRREGDGPRYTFSRATRF